ncbi:MAG: hypothetical protein AB7F86_13865, partial [Bdellovibrionales bacterium]
SGGTKKSEGGGGVVDGGGGGELRLHNREEALKEIESAWKLLTETRPDNPLQVGAEYLEWKVYAARATWYRGKPLTKEESGVLQILVKMYHDNGGWRPAERGFGKYSNTPLTENLRGKKINFLEEGLCKGPSHSERIASVSKLDLTGELCVSLPAVQKMPYAGVTSTPLIALLIHEIAHLYGYGEEDAQLIQDFYLRNMKTIMGFRVEERKRKIAASVDRNVQKVRSVLRHDDIGDIHLDAYQGLANDFASIRESIPAPYTLESLPKNDPDQYEKIYRASDDLAEGFAAMAKDLARERRKKKRDVPLTRAISARLLELALGAVELHKQVNLYLFADENPMEMAANELDVETRPLTEREVRSWMDPDYKEDRPTPKRPPSVPPAEVQK